MSPSLVQVEESSTHSSQILFLFVCLFDFLNAFFLTLSCGDDELTNKDYYQSVKSVALFVPKDFIALECTAALSLGNNILEL